MYQKVPQHEMTKPESELQLVNDITNERIVYTKYPRSLQDKQHEHTIFK